MEVDAVGCFEMVDVGDRDRLCDPPSENGTTLFANKNSHNIEKSHRIRFFNGVSQTIPFDTCYKYSCLNQTF